MKNIISFLLLFAALTSAHAQITASSFTTQTITIPADRYTVYFAVFWTCADFPVTSTPGRVELVNGLNQIVGWAEGHVTQFGAAGNTNLGTVEVLGSDLSIMAPDLSVADGTFTGIWHVTGVTPGTYTLRFWDFETQPGMVFASTVWTQTLFQGGSTPPPANVPPVVTVDAPGAQTVTAGTVLALQARATDADGNITGHNLDIQRPAGDWNFQGGFAVGEPYQGGPVGSGSNSTRTANFTFTDVGTYYVRSAASDGSGWYHSATVAITVVAPPPVSFALGTAANAGGAVSAGGTYTAGTTVMVTATPDGTHDFAGWSGDAGGSANPLAVLMDRAKTVQANFTPKSFLLTTNASGGGNVTPGGNYPYGTTVTITAAADATHRFAGWAGDASGSAPSIALTITRPLAVQAVFESKTAQTIAFPAIADQSVGASFPLIVKTSSGLPVTLTVIGPATYAGGVLTLTGPGPVSITATQAGDGYYLPAAPITRTFNAAAPVVLRYQATGRTFLQTGRTPASIPYVIQPTP